MAPHDSKEKNEMIARLLLEGDTYRKQIAKLKQQLTRARARSTQDALTKLNNRRAWNSDAKSRIQRAQRGPKLMALFIMDVNAFKQVNDTFGHPVGYRVLATVARKIRLSLRPEDLCARVGGDEFAALLSNISAEEAYKVANRIWENVTKIVMSIPDLRPSVSIGAIVLRPDALFCLKDGMKFADLRLYKAKKKNGTRDALGNPTPTIVVEEIA